jgi:hypothetical protein
MATRAALISIVPLCGHAFTTGMFRVKRHSGNRATPLNGIGRSRAWLTRTAARTESGTEDDADMVGSRNERFDLLFAGEWADAATNTRHLGPRRKRPAMAMAVQTPRTQPIPRTSGGTSHPSTTASAPLMWTSIS